MKSLLTFPPILFYTVIIIGAIVVNAYTILGGTVQNSEMMEMQQMMIDMLEPTVLVDKNAVTKPSKVTITLIALAPGMEMKMDYSGYLAKVEVYTPYAEVYEIKEGTIGEKQKVKFELEIKGDAPSGRYSVIPYIGPNPSKLIMGDPEFFKVERR